MVGDNNTWGFFPSVSFTWDMKKESFLANITSSRRVSPPRTCHLVSECRRLLFRLLLSFCSATISTLSKFHGLKGGQAELGAQPPPDRLGDLGGRLGDALVDVQTAVSCYKIPSNQTAVTAHKLEIITNSQQHNNGYEIATKQFLKEQQQVTKFKTTQYQMSKSEIATQIVCNGIINSNQLQLVMQQIC